LEAQIISGETSQLVSGGRKKTQGSVALALLIEEQQGLHEACTPNGQSNGWDL
jgi:hypothetical protein